MGLMYLLLGNMGGMWGARLLFLIFCNNMGLKNEDENGEWLSTPSISP